MVHVNVKMVGLEIHVVLKIAIHLAQAIKYVIMENVHVEMVLKEINVIYKIATQHV